VVGVDPHASRELDRVNPAPRKFHLVFGEHSEAGTDRHREHHQPQLIDQAGEQQ
jgi:hypothetical protein